MISKVVKGAHRRMSANGKGDETDRDDD